MLRKLWVNITQRRQSTSSVVERRQHERALKTCPRCSILNEIKNSSQNNFNYKFNYFRFNYFLAAWKRIGSFERLRCELRRNSLNEAIWWIFVLTDASAVERARLWHQHQLFLFTAIKPAERRLRTYVASLIGMWGIQIKAKHFHWRLCLVAYFIMQLTFSTFRQPLCVPL